MTEEKASSKKTEEKASSEKKAGLIEMLGKGQATIEIGAKKYDCRAPEIADTAQFAVTVQEELMESVYTKAEKVLDTLMGKGISEDAALDMYMKIIEGGSVDEWKLIRMLGSIKGTRFLFLACASDAHPELTEDAVKKMITTKNWRPIQRKLSTLKGPAPVKNVLSGESPAQ